MRLSGMVPFLMHMYTHAHCEKCQMRSMVMISLKKHCRTVALKIFFPLFVYKGCLRYKFLAHPQEYSILSPASSQWYFGVRPILLHYGDNDWKCIKEWR
jgi:hypothetical protein